jgi:hypothetical protein
MSNIDAVREGFKAISDRGLGALLDVPHTADLTVHVSSLRITASGEAEVREKFLDVMEQVHARVELTDLIADGPFVSCTIKVESDLRPDPTTGVEVFRFEGDEMAEIWAITPPLPA